jgi:hypothetical protein
MLIISLFLVFLLLDLKAVQPSIRVVEFRGCAVEYNRPTPATPEGRPLGLARNVAPNWRAEV